MSDLVRMLTSLIAPETLAALVDANYDLGTPVRCKLISHNDNDPYLLTAVIWPGNACLAGHGGGKL
ncbi:MAG TPA: hypothetical protein VGQ24_16740 [Gemmatimonadales bacterium]|jgi:hypothetical protein|nr:hypothetical protein [Gemmatimonadales bacterium]